MQGQGKPSAPRKNLNVRSSKREALGLDYLRVKRELAAELPLSGAKQPKSVTPSQSASVAPSNQNAVAGSTSQSKKRVQRIPLQPQTLEPKILVSERQSLPSNNKNKMDELAAKANDNSHHTLDPQILESDRQQIVPKEKQRNLIEQHKRQWIQKERQQQMTQLSE